MAWKTTVKVREWPYIVQQLNSWKNNLYPNYCGEETFVQNLSESPKCFSEKEVNFYVFENKEKKLY